MRHIGNLPDDVQARIFVDFLLVRGVNASFERDADGWAVWILDEDDVELAKTELASFRLNPTDPAKVEAAAQAAALRDAHQRRAKQTQARVVDMSQRWRRPAGAQLPLTMLLSVICLGVSLAGDFGRRPEPMYNRLSFLNWAGPRAASPFRDIARGEWWRLVTPIFLHLSYSHLLFNTYSLIVLGGMTEVRLGPWRALALVLAFALLSNVVQAVFGSPYFGGISGVVFGLFGLVWMRSLFLPESGFYISPTNVAVTLFWFVACLVGAAGPIANAAHWAGLVAGMIAGYAPKLWRDLRR